MKKQIMMVVAAIATVGAATSAFAAAEDPKTGTVAIGQCNTASAYYEKLRGSDRGHGFAGGNLAAVLVNAGAGQSGAVFTPIYDKGKFPINNFFTTDGSFAFKGVPANAELRAYFATGGSASQKISNLDLYDLGNGWTGCYWSTVNFGVTQIPYSKMVVVEPNTGNMTVGNFSINYGTNNSSGGARGGTSTPGEVNMTPHDCSIL